MNVLIVEDEKLTLTALQQCVESLGHKVFLAESGEQAITQITENKIDFILSDIMMPGISGLSLLSIIRNVYLFKMPIVLISKLDNEQIIKSMLQLGANGFISKPFDTADLKNEIAKYIHA